MYQLRDSSESINLYFEKNITFLIVIFNFLLIPPFILVLTNFETIEGIDVFSVKLFVEDCFVPSLTAKSLPFLLTASILQ